MFRDASLHAHCLVVSPSDFFQYNLDSALTSVRENFHVFCLHESVGLQAYRPSFVADLTPAINIYVDAAPSILATAIGKPIHGVRIANNTIVNPRTAAVGVAYTQNAAIMNNTIVNPMAAGLQTAWGSARNYEHPSAILLDAVENVCVAGNRITVKDLRLVPEVNCLRRANTKAFFSKLLSTQLLTASHAHLSRSTFKLASNAIC